MPSPLLPKWVCSAHRGRSPWGRGRGGCGRCSVGSSSTTTVITESAREPSTLAAPHADAMTINEIYERAAPGVVQIARTSSSTDVLSGTAPSALGSGFVVDKASHIVTNFHVVEDADEIRVSFSNRDTVEAELVASDPSTDLAVLRVDAEAKALTPLPLGDSDDVRVGDPVVAIGNPFGLDRPRRQESSALFNG